MEALQPSRPPMSQQPPQRIDGNNNNNNSTVTNPVENKEADKPEILSSPTNNTSNKSNTINNNNNNNNKDNGIPDVDISKAYKRRSLKKRVECGIFVQIGKQEIEELSMILGAKKCQMFGESFSDNISSCVVCDEQCISGQFAVETVLFIPNKNTKYDSLGRFRTELPRMACHECAAEYQQENNITIKNNDSNNKESLGKIWNMYQNGELNQKQTDQNQSNPSNQSAQTQIQHQHQTSAASLSSINMPVSLPPVAAGNNINDNDDNKIGLSPPDQHQHHQLPHQQLQQHQHQHSHQAQQGQQVNSPHVHEAERDPFDDGFLICTQLVKTGGADQGGLQVGDVFVEFGHYSKKRFPGLKSIANLVRRSAGKEINVVVWRKLEQMNGVEDDGTGRTVFQKLALKLKPLQSHDADGGGVLGAVINTYPLPEMKN